MTVTPIFRFGGVRRANLVFAAGAAYVAYLVARLVHRRLRTRALLRLPGPKCESWLYGSVKGLSDDAPLFLEESWLQAHGTTLKIYGLLGTPILMTLDLAALKHILSHSEIYHKSEGLRWNLGTMLGHGLLFVEGDEHKKQRRIMNPAFGPIQVRRFTSLFISKAKEMTGIWMDMCTHTTRKDGRLKIDAFSFLNKATLDIIGLAGFNHDIDSLHAPADRPSPLNEAVRSIFSFDNMNLLAVLQIVFKSLRILPSARRSRIGKANQTIREMGTKLIADKKAAILASRLASEDSSGIKREDFEGNDLLTLLIKSNMASDLPEDARMSDEDLIAQIGTFIVAGHETTSTAAAWALFAMSCSRDVQEKLRAEVRALSTDNPTDAELNSLTYLDNVVRETFRLYGPVYGTMRTATRDDCVPLRDPYTDVDGILRSELHLREGDIINIPIVALQRRTEIWGDDAHEFRPERWESLPEIAKDIPSTWGHLMTFIAGQHACIGYRFAVSEMKALLFTVVRSFEFELAVSPADIMGRISVVTRPSIVGHPAGGSQLPLVITPVRG